MCDAFEVGIKGLYGNTEKQIILEYLRLRELKHNNCDSGVSDKDFQEVSLKVDFIMCDITHEGHIDLIHTNPMYIELIQYLGLVYIQEAFNVCKDSILNLNPNLLTEEMVRHIKERSCVHESSR